MTAQPAARHLRGSGAGSDARRGASAVVRDVLLNVAAAGGALCILVTLAAVFFHVSLIMFKTGSMAPAIPAGSLAVVREVPVSEVKTGDVVTVERQGKLPVTHRVTSVRLGEDGTGTLTMKGDANPVEDPAPYTVSTVRTVLWSAPGLAQWVAQASNPFVLGGVTLSVAGLVTWVLWPRDEGPRDEGPRDEGPMDEEAGDA
ncbi:signal peptidase I [Arthrobacter sp. SW1]|uniref:signal peptidase I n=1 Tax=Arthrobacter sp. SW1 TaxID=1920889 RepID=UPI000877DA9A|nr:signal peptidase I [Arthrobacter sp. SW1]OFI39067.1 signal peptidase I [Arthrobacter sp. SW1]